MKNTINDILIETQENSQYSTPQNNINEGENSLKNSLIEMGYEKNQMDALFENVVIHSIEQAIEYLSKGEDNLYNHTFIAKQNNYLICRICNDSRNFHHNRYSLTFNAPPRPRPVNRRQTVNRRRNNDIINDDILDSEDLKFEEEELEDDCDVCMANKKVNMYLSLKCEHKFCRECWENYLKEKINNGNVIDIKCMDASCKEILIQGDVRKILVKNEKELYSKYKRFLKNKIKENSVQGKKYKHCPKENCDEIVLENPKTKFVECAKGHQFCFECLDKWHENKKCNKNSDTEKFYKWKNKKHTKECPNCQYVIEKNGGCNHMTCQHCKYQWCWICGGKYTSSHYSTGPCAGMQFKRIKYIDNKFYKWYVSHLSDYVFFIFVIIGCSLFGSMIGLGSLAGYYYDTNPDYNVSDMQILYLVVVEAIVGIAFQPLVFGLCMVFLALYIVLGIPFAFKINRLVKHAFRNMHF